MDSVNTKKPTNTLPKTQAATPVSGDKLVKSAASAKSSQSQK